MSSINKLKHPEIYQKIKTLSNRKRFLILELTDQKECTITELSTKLNLAYNKCSDYLSLLYKYKLISKKRVGKEVKITSRVHFKDNMIEFI